MVSYSMIIKCMVFILRVLLIGKMMGLFLAAEEEGGRKIRAGLICYYLLTIVPYSMRNLSLVFEICNYLGIAGLTLFYEGTWKKRIWVSLAIFTTDLACALAVHFSFPQRFIEHQQAVQTLLLLICVMLISHFACPADTREMVFDKKQTGILIAIPVASIFILGVLLYGREEGTMAMLLCILILVINLSICYFYHMMAENYRSLRENDRYRQQTYLYRNQLDVIMESQGRIRALKHDMKNHILALQVLLQKREWEEANRYLCSMQEFMTNPSEYITTGNESIDSLLNYKLQRANEVLATVAARVSIPEKLMLHSFDLNVVLGNLLDNAIEAAAQTEEKELKLTIRLEKGILFLHICNSCQGIAEGRAGHLETTKEDASNHGIGLGNVKGIIEKYHGEMELVCKNRRMETDIIMYINGM